MNKTSTPSIIWLEYINIIYIYIYIYYIFNNTYIKNEPRLIGYKRGIPIKLNFQLLVLCKHSTCDQRYALSNMQTTDLQVEGSPLYGHSWSASCKIINLIYAAIHLCFLSDFHIKHEIHYFVGCHWSLFWLPSVSYSFPFDCSSCLNMCCRFTFTMLILRFVKEYSYYSTRQLL